MFASRLGAALLAVLTCAPADGATAAHGKATGCDDLSSIPLNYGVDYATQVDPIFSGCISCHNQGSADGDLNLQAAPDTLVNVTSSQNAAYIRVIPANAAQSLLFQKVNCAVTDFGTRMPPPSGALTLAEQALIYDWIEQGAQPAEASDWIFRGNFESTR